MLGRSGWNDADNLIGPTLYCSGTIEGDVLVVQHILGIQAQEYHQECCCCLSTPLMSVIFFLYDFSCLKKNLISGDMGGMGGMAKAFFKRDGDFKSSNRYPWSF